MKSKLIMYVYGDITTDARVNRAANALADNYDVMLISTQWDKKVEDTYYKNVLIGTNKTGLKNLLSNILEAYRIIKIERPDIVYCHDYYSAILAYLLIGKKYCRKIIYDAHELIIPEPCVKDRRLSFFRWFEKRIIKKVNLAVCASSERGDFMKDYYKLEKTPLAIRNISQLSVNEDNDTKSLLSKLDDFFSVDIPTVVYAGVVTKSRRIIELEHAVAKHKSQFKLLIVGTGDALEEVKDRASQDGICFAYTGKIPYKCLGAVLKKCDIGFVYYPTNTLNNTYCASNKVYEYASVALPMISNLNPTIKKEMEENYLGVASDKLDEALCAVASGLSEYKKACIEYTSNNPWASDAHRLVEAIEKC